MNNEYPEITAIPPVEPGETPEGYVKMPIPFVGIYQSLLGADIDHLIDSEIERCESDGITIKEIKIRLDPIYKSIVEYTADILLGAKGAIYAGTVCPKYYNYVDDQPYVFVPEEFYVEHIGKPDEKSRLQICGMLIEMLEPKIDPWYAREYIYADGDTNVPDAVYAQWANGTYNGYEEIFENLEIID
jgi:hypothetical protein